MERRLNTFQSPPVKLREIQCRHGQKDRFMSILNLGKTCIFLRNENNDPVIKDSKNHQGLSGVIVRAPRAHSAISDRLRLRLNDADTL